MRNIKAIFIKQLQSLIKNPGMLVQAVLYIVLVAVITFLAGGNDVKDDCDA